LFVLGSRIISLEEAVYTKYTKSIQKLSSG